MKRILPLALLVAGCGGGAPEANETAPAAFVPPVTEAPEPVAGQRNTTPLTAYLGRSPRDAVDGVSFFDRTDVSGVLIDMIADADLRDQIIGREARQFPVFRKGSLIAAHGCVPDDCEGRNWTVLVAADGNRDLAAVCQHDAATLGDTSRWSTRRGDERRPGRCPRA